MKLLAILRDSFRETVDSRVFTILLAMSLGVILLFASLSFTPKPFTGLNLTLSETLNRDAGSLAADRRVYWMIRSVQFLDGPEHHPATPLRLTLSARQETPEIAQTVRNDLSQLRQTFEDRLRNPDGWQLIRIVDVRPATIDNPVMVGVTERDVVVELDARPTAKMRLIWPHECQILFGLLSLEGGFWQFVLEHPDTPPLGRQLWFLEDQIINGPLCWFAVMISVIVTAFFIPNMMQKGRLDLLLTKPITRVGLLIYKYLGGLLFIFLNSLFAIGGAWIVIGLRSGVWEPAILASVLIITFFFAILYSVSTLAAVLTRNGVVAIVATCLVWLLLFGVGRTYTFLYDNAEKLRVRDPSALQVPEWALPTATVVHHVLPRTDDLNPLITRLLAGSLMTPEEFRGFNLDTQAVNWTETVGVSLTFIALFLGVACWCFSAGDY